MKKFFKRCCSNKLASVFMLIFLACLLLVILAPMYYQQKLRLSLVSAFGFILCVFDVQISGKLDDNSGKHFCSSNLFNQIDIKYGSDPLEENEVLNSIHTVYSDLTIKPMEMTKCEKKHNNEIDIKELLHRSLDLKFKISIPKLITESAVVLLPMFYCVVIIIPDLSEQYLRCSKYKTLGVAASILVGFAILVLMAISLSRRKEDMKTELMNYELKLIEKKISEFQDKSIQQQQIKKEESDEK